MFEKSIYQQRRQRLSELLSDGMVLLCGNRESPFNSPGNHYPFRQDSSFLYFAGHDVPEMALLIDLEEGREILFGNEPSLSDRIWSGSLPSLAERGEMIGVTESAPLTDLGEMVGRGIAKGKKLSLLPTSRAENKLFLMEHLGLSPAGLDTHVSPELIRAVVGLRSVKGPEEVAELDEAADLNYEVHVAAMRMAEAGVHEWQIAGEIQAVAARAGRLLSFPPIVTVHGEILHNHTRNNRLQRGDLLLVDAGVESSLHYASDHTRTTPVGGVFSLVQKPLYEIVLSCIERARELIRPGVRYADIHRETCLVLASGLVDLGLMRGAPEEAVAVGAHALFMPHGLGHMLGIDVHDMEDLGEDFVGYDKRIVRSEQFGAASLRLARKLQAGFALTVEPGIYFIPPLIERWQSEKMHEDFINYSQVETYAGTGGMRVEDDVLVTEKGNRLLGDRRIPFRFDMSDMPPY